MLDGSSRVDVASRLVQYDTSSMPGIGGTNGSEPAATITFDAASDSTPSSVRTSTAPGP